MRSPSARRGCLRRLLWFALLALVLINALAWVQARAMTHFVTGGQPLRQFAALSPVAQLQQVFTGVRLPRPENYATPAAHYLPFETRHIPLTESGQLEAWYVPHPESRGVVLMFPGYAGVKEAFLTPAAELYRLGYSSLLVDFRGSGGSSGDDTTLGLREADDVAAAFRYAQQQWPEQPIVLYGISMGGAAILRAVAVDHVHPSAIIVEGVFDRLLTTVRHRFDAVHLPAWPAAPLLVFWGSVQIGYNGFAHNPIDYATSVACPILVLHGERDPWISADETAALVAQISSPKQLIEVPGLGHDMPFVYGAHDLWVSAVTAFLRKAAAS